MKYDLYKDSEIDWVSDIPKHWQLDRLKNIFSFGTGLSITKKNLLDEGIPCVNYGEIHSKYAFEVNPKIHFLKCVGEEHFLTSKKSILEYGDFVFADTSEDIEGSGNFTYLNSYIQVFAGYHTIVAKPKDRINHRYTAYLLDSVEYRSQFRSNVAGIKVYSITQGLLNRLKIFFPTPQEQIAIANYLDSKTQAIDKKIGLLEKKITNYQELRKSLINETVTKGLNKDVNLKDSGIDWIGRIPEHWGLIRMKDEFKIFKQVVGSQSDDYKLLSLTQKGVIYRDIEKAFGKYPAEFDSYQVVLKGDLIYCLFDMDVTPRTIGFSEYNGMITGAYTIIRPLRNASSKYFFYLYLMADVGKKLSKYYTGLRNTIKKEIFMGLNVPIPPIEEQVEIAEYLEEKTTKIDQITENIRTQINTLKELRKTLINDVVTGKIKVT